MTREHEHSEVLTNNKNKTPFVSWKDHDPAAIMICTIALGLLYIILWIPLFLFEQKKIRGWSKYFSSLRHSKPITLTIYWRFSFKNHIKPLLHYNKITFYKYAHIYIYISLMFYSSEFWLKNCLRWPCKKFNPLLRYTWP